MKFQTFTGHSTNGLDLAVRDAYKDYESWTETNRYAVTIEHAPATTANICIVNDEAEYWFTLTITYREN